MISRCGSGWDEDLLHFMLECPAYDHIREDHPSLFAHGSLPAGDRLLQVFNHDDQARLADCVWQMNLYRAELLGLTRPIDAYREREVTRGYFHHRKWYSPQPNETSSKLTGRTSKVGKPTQYT